MPQQGDASCLVWLDGLAGRLTNGVLTPDRMLDSGHHGSHWPRRYDEDFSCVDALLQAD
jgi:hypothetical protein